jgi:rhodanese-related sulfurtransferase
LKSHQNAISSFMEKIVNLKEGIAEMKAGIRVWILLVGLCVYTGERASGAEIENIQIDIGGFFTEAGEAGALREKNRVSVEDFVRMSREEGTIILDTRSKEMFERKHLKGALHLNFSDITKGSLEKVIPNKGTRILIYCNNNFRNNSLAFAPKSAAAALNIPTFITLYTYGYRNVYELGPVEDEQNTILEFDENP